MHAWRAKQMYRACRDFMTRIAPRLNATAAPRRLVPNVPLGEGSASAAKWDALIETSYDVLAEAQCDGSGMYPNWWVPAASDKATLVASSP